MSFVCEGRYQNLRINAGLYTHINIGAIHAQCIWRSADIALCGILLSKAAFPKANSSQTLDSKALDVSKVRTSPLLEGLLYCWLMERCDTIAGGSC